MSTATQAFRITGMDCADCARTIEHGVAKLDGVRSCTLNFTAAVLKVDGHASPDAVVARVRALGYDVRQNTAETATPARGLAALVARLPEGGAAGFLRFLLERASTTLAVIGVLLILPGLLFVEIFPMLGIDSPLFTTMSLGALAISGFPVARSAWRALKLNHEIGINALMVIAAIGAVIIGAHTEAGMVMVLFAIGEALEGYTMARARRAITSLMTIAPSEATVLRPCLDCADHLGQNGYHGGACPMCGMEESRVFCRRTAHRRHRDRQTR